MHLSPLLLEETRTALLSSRLRGPDGHDEAAVMAWCAALQASQNVFSGPLSEIGRACRDPDDDHVIATAIAAGAEVIVTSDKDLLALGQFRAVRILAARDFLTEIANERSDPAPSAT